MGGFIYIGSYYRAHTNMPTAIHAGDLYEHESIIISFKWIFSDARKERVLLISFNF